MMFGLRHSSGTTNGSGSSLKNEWLRVLGRRSLIGTLIGWESIRRTMRREDDLAHRDAIAYHKAIHGETVPDEDDMGDFSGNLVLGDMHTSPKKTGRNGLLPFLLGAGLTAATAYYGVPWLKDVLMPPAVTDTDTRYDIDGRDGGVW